MKYFLNGFILPFHPHNLFLFREDEVAQIIDWQKKTFSAGVIDGLCAIAHIGWVKLRKFIPVIRVDGGFSIHNLLHPFLPLPI
jgi:hypothetical protein